jgi:hypothetical protein
LSATAEELSAQAAQLQDLVSNFQLDSGHAAHGRASARAADSQAPRQAAAVRPAAGRPHPGNPTNAAKPSAAAARTSVQAEIDEAAFTAF